MGLPKKGYVLTVVVAKEGLFNVNNSVNLVTVGLHTPQ